MRASALGQRFAAAHQHLDPAPTPLGPLRRQPVLEFRCARHREPLEELAGHQLGRGVPLARLGQPLELVHVDFD